MDGVVTNTGSNSWICSPAAEVHVKVGIRVYPAGLVSDENPNADNPVVDGRAPIEAQGVRPGKGARFNLDLDISTLPFGEYVGVLDLVVDHQLWFSEYGQKPTLVPFAHSESHPVLDFNLTFDEEAGFTQKQNTLEFSGVLRNCGNIVLQLGEGADGVRLGAQFYLGSDVADLNLSEPPTHDVRARVSEAFLLPNAESRFEFIVPLVEFTPGTYLIKVDLVQEGAFWFSDRGARPYWLRWRFDRTHSTRPLKIKWLDDPPDRMAELAA